MRICSIVTSLTSGGAETLVTNLSEEFSANHHDSVVLALCDAVTLGNSVEAEDRLKAQIKGAGGRFVSLGLPASRKLVAGNTAMRRVLRELQPDVIHAHTARALLMMLAGKARAPVVLTHHNSVLGFPPALFRVFDRIASAYVAISRETQTLLSHYVRRPVAVIVNAAGRGFACDAPKSTPSSPMQILSVGTISDQKNYQLLIETARLVRDRRLIDPMPEFRIAGNGADLGKMREAAFGANLQNHVQFLGERSDVRTLMLSTDIYLNTSHYEGMPIALLEAMRMGLPIVATDVAGNNELVVPGQTGLLEAEEPLAIATAIQSLAVDHALYARLSRGALARAEEYSIRTAAEHHLRLYHSLQRQAKTAPGYYPKG